MKLQNRSKGVEDFERSNSISIPEEYREFLIENRGSTTLKKLERSLDICFPGKFGEFYKPNERFPHSSYLRILDLPDRLPKCETQELEDCDDFIDIVDGALYQRAGRLCLFETDVDNLGAVHYILVLNGPCRGEVWVQEVPTGYIKPLNTDIGSSPKFKEWYESWRFQHNG